MTKLLELPLALFELLFELLRKAPYFIPVVDAEFFSLGLHMTLIKVNSNAVVNRFVEFFAFLRGNCSADYLMYLLSCSNFFFDLVRFEKLAYSETLAAPSIRKLSPNSAYFLRRMHEVCDPSQVEGDCSANL